MAAAHGDFAARKFARAAPNLVFFDPFSFKTTIAACGRSRRLPTAQACQGRNRRTVHLYLLDGGHGDGNAWPQDFTSRKGELPDRNRRATVALSAAAPPQRIRMKCSMRIGWQNGSAASRHR